MLNAALSEVNWGEVADYWLEEEEKYEKNEMTKETAQLITFLRTEAGQKILQSVREEYPNFIAHPRVIVSFALHRLPEEFNDEFLGRVFS